MYQPDSTHPSNPASPHTEHLGSPQEGRWYRQPTVIGLLFFCCWPVALYMMWKGQLWSKQTRWIITGILVLVNVGVLSNRDRQPETPKAIQPAPQVAIAPTVEAPVQPPPPPAPVEPVQEAPADRLTRSQRNALRSAKDYLQMSGFSRKGLIDQLSSSYGNGYSSEDATAAVDSLDPDWNKQATRAAAEYLQMQGFSCRQLIGQLSSSYGNKFTKAQAEYGAQQAGACD